jgi:hypothetical protein
VSIIAAKAAVSPPADYAVTPGAISLDATRIITILIGFVNCDGKVMEYEADISAFEPQEIE